MVENKEVVVITGASRGIGKSIALKLADEGKVTVLFARDEERLKSIAEKINNSGGEAIIFRGDVSDENFVSTSIGSVLKKYGKIDHLINNAGLAIFKKFNESSLDEFKQQIDINVYGVYNFTKAVINDMIRRKSGSIITISSLAGKNGFAYGTMYSASKHAVMGFSKSLMLEVREHNIRVAAICPGSVATEMIMNTPIEPNDKNKILHPDDVAEVVSTVLRLPPRALVNEIEIRPTNPKG